MSDGNQLPPAGETACPTDFAKRLIQQGGAGGFACRSHGHNQWSASKLNTCTRDLRGGQHSHESVLQSSARMRSAPDDDAARHLPVAVIPTWLTLRMASLKINAKAATGNPRSLWSHPAAN